MKRSIKIFILALCLLASANSGFALNNDIRYRDEPDPEAQIILQGQLRPLGRSRFQALPISASVDSENLYVDFNVDLGNLTITIYNAMGGVAHDETVYAQSNDSMQISLNGYAPGSYLVVFSNASGSMMGKFDL